MSADPSLRDDLEAQTAPGAAQAQIEAASDVAAEGATAGAARQAQGSQLLRIAALLIAIAITVSLVIFRDQLIRFAGLGYIGLFIIGLLGSATVILPMPGLALVFGAGATLSPVLVGLAFGTGAALGELTGYLAGYGGSVMLSDQLFMGRIATLLRKWGAWMVFALALLPNPAFDIVGIGAGAIRIPVWQFLVAAWCGNVIKAILVALAGAGAVNLLTPFVREWLTR